MLHVQYCYCDPVLQIVARGEEICSCECSFMLMVLKGFEVSEDEVIDTRKSSLRPESYFAGRRAV